MYEFYNTFRLLLLDVSLVSSNMNFILLYTESRAEAKYVLCTMQTIIKMKSLKIRNILHSDLKLCATSDFILGSLSWPEHPSGKQRWPICPASSASSKKGEHTALLFSGLAVTSTHPQKLPRPEHALHGKTEARHGPWCQHVSNPRNHIKCWTHARRNAELE